jgi:hypothetical protein
MFIETKQPKKDTSSTKINAEQHFLSLIFQQKKISATSSSTSFQIMNSFHNLKDSLQYLKSFYA